MSIETQPAARLAPPQSVADDAESPARSNNPPPASTDDVNQVDEETLALGHRMFVHRWRPNDELASGGDGLGPVYNGTSCVECHSKGGLGGAASNEHNVHQFEILPSKAGQRVRSGVIHAFATSVRNQESLQAVDRYFRPGKVVAGSVTPGVRGLSFQVEIEANRHVLINSPALWGLGRIDGLSRDQLEQSVQIPDPNADGLSLRSMRGRYRLVGDGGIGKFGWKGQFATLREFVAHACANEIGLSNTAAAQYAPGQFRPDHRARPDLSEEQLSALVKFVADLPEPGRVMPDDLTHRGMAEKGEGLVASIGCTHCHTRNVGDVQDVYSDYRLHKVEDTISTVDPYYTERFTLQVALPSSYPELDEWRTPALWGVGDTAPYWHDGSAKTLKEAILRHGREARPVVDSYRRLRPEDQQCVLMFLSTLRGPGAKEMPTTGTVEIARNGPTFR